MRAAKGDQAHRASFSELECPLVIFSCCPCLTEFVESIKQPRGEYTFSTYASEGGTHMLPRIFSLNNNTSKSFNSEFCSNNRVLIVESGLNFHDSEHLMLLAEHE